MVKTITKIVNLKDVIIGKHLIRDIEDIKEKEDLQSLMRSIQEMGQLHPCTVRMVGNKYELIAGHRRYAAISQGKDKEIEVKVVDASDLRARELAITENRHRKNVRSNVEDANIFDTWELGTDTGEYKQNSDCAQKLSIGINDIENIIVAEELKRSPEYKNNVIIQTATTSELANTNIIANYPELRIKILRLAQERGTTDKDVLKSARIIKEAMKAGASEEEVIFSIDKHSPLGNAQNDDEVKQPIDGVPITTLITTSEVIIEPTTEPTTAPAVIFQVNKFADTLNTLAISPEDIKDSILKGEISVEDAKKLNEFDTEERRKQVIEEKKVIENQKRISNELYDRDIQMNIETRKKQQEDLKNKGETEHKTQFDTALKKKLEKEANKDEIHDDEYIERYQKLASYTASTFANFHPRLLRTVEGKITVLNIIKGLHDFYHNVLVEMGEIKEVKIENESRKTENSKYSNVVDIEIIAKQ